MDIIADRDIFQSVVQTLYLKKDIWVLLTRVQPNTTKLQAIKVDSVMWQASCI